MSEIVLVSASPRRRTLLAALGHTVLVRPGDASEAWPEDAGAPTDVGAAAIAIAARKLATLGPCAQPALAADTVVWDGAPLGKPADDAAARATLARLAGRSHQVVTGFVLRVGARSHRQAVTTEVRFRPLTAAAIAAYVATGEGRDKAGGYAIQGAGAALVDTIAGSLTGVIGLPLAEVAAALETLT